MSDASKHLHFRSSHIAVYTKIVLSFQFLGDIKSQQQYFDSRCLQWRKPSQVLQKWSSPPPLPRWWWNLRVPPPVWKLQLVHIRFSTSTVCLLMICKGFREYLCNWVAKPHGGFIMVAVETSIDVGNILWIFYDCLYRKPLQIISELTVAASPTCIDGQICQRSMVIWHRSLHWYLSNEPHEDLWASTLWHYQDSIMGWTAQCSIPKSSFLSLPWVFSGKSWTFKFYTDSVQLHGLTTYFTIYGKSFEK